MGTSRDPARAPTRETRDTVPTSELHVGVGGHVAILAVRVR